MEKDEFTDFFRAVYPSLLRFVSRLVDPVSAEEICTDSMVTVWSKGLSSPQGDDDWDRLRALTYVVAKGHVRNHLRSAQRRSSLLARLVSRTLREDEIGTDVAEEILSGLDAAKLLGQLPRHEQHVMALSLDGYHVAEISAILGCSEDAVRMRAMRARKRLVEILDKESAYDVP